MTDIDYLQSFVLIVLKQRGNEHPQLIYKEDMTMRLHKTILASAVLAAFTFTAITGVQASPHEREHGENHEERYEDKHHGKKASCDHAPYTLQGGALSDTDKASLALMREEEKLAHDIYKTLATQWNLKIFRNIGAAEQHHMERVHSLLDYYQLPDAALP
jgi:hypothetical protein